MGRRRNKSAAAAGSAMDIMTALIGCLILILLGILVIILVSQVMVVLAEPDQTQVHSIVISEVDGFRETEAFPRGNTVKEPLYVDVHPNYLFVYGYDLRFSAPDIWTPGNEYDTIVDTVAHRSDSEYILFLVRPGATELYDALIKKLTLHNQNPRTPRESQIDYGVELYESFRTIDAGRTTRAREGLEFVDLSEWDKTGSEKNETIPPEAESSSLPQESMPVEDGGGE